MYGLHVLVISFLGISVYLYAGAKRRRVTFHLLTVLMLMAPILLDFLAMVHGSGEIFPVGQSWFNGRYLIFIAPLLAFGSACLLNFAIEITRIKNPLVMIITIVIIAGSYAFTFASQGFEYGKSVALNGAGLLPSDRDAQVSVETGKQLGGSYEEGNIVLFTVSGETHRIMLESQLPLKKFIDLSNRGYWEISEQSPWIYGNYVVLQKQVDQMSYDPLKEVAQYWHDNKQTLLEHYNLIYENDRFEILKRK
jgi:hypothetical protein